MNESFVKQKVKVCDESFIFFNIIPNIICNFAFSNENNNKNLIT